MKVGVFPGVEGDSSGEPITHMGSATVPASCVYGWSTRKSVLHREPRQGMLGRAFNELIQPEKAVNNIERQITILLAEKQRT